MPNLNQLSFWFMVRLTSPPPQPCTAFYILTPLPHSPPENRGEGWPPLPRTSLSFRKKLVKFFPTFTHYLSPLLTSALPSPLTPSLFFFFLFQLFSLLSSFSLRISYFLSLSSAFCLRSFLSLSTFSLSLYFFALPLFVFFIYVLSLSTFSPYSLSSLLFSFFARHHAHQ